MSSETIVTVVKFLPTLLALLIIVLCTLRGFLRGFRKSLILLIHYVISIVVGFIMYFSISKFILSDQLNSYFTSLGADFSNANSIYDLIKILLNTYLPDYAAIAANPYIEQALMAFVGLGVSLVIGIVSLVLTPWIIRLFLYILYLLFYREGKVKRHKLAEGDIYNPHRLLGMAVGALRGVVCATLTVSLISSSFFVLSGGEVKTEASTENILILEGLSNEIDFDLNAVYNGLKESRATGVGKIFDAILVKGKPIDLYYSDLFLTSNFKSLKNDNSDGTVYTSETTESIVAELCLREEMALVVRLLENILETNAITIVDGNVDINYELLDENLDNYVTDYVNGSVILSEVTPLVIVGLVESINDGSLVVEESIKTLFTPEVIDSIKKLDFSNDLSKLISAVVNAVDLIPVNEETNSFDFAALANINTYFNFDKNVVKQLFVNLSDIALLTKVVFPVGVGLALNTMGETIEAAGINPTELDLTNLDWQVEIANIGTIYEKVVDLNLDVNKLLDSSLNESGLSNSLQYILDLCTNDEMIDGVEKSEIFKKDLVELIDTIFESNLFGQVGLVFIKSQIAGIEILAEDGSSTPLNDAFNLVKNNLNYYTKSDLQHDLNRLVSSCLDVTSLIPLFMGGEEINIFEILYSLETDDVKQALLGVYLDEPLEEPIEDFYDDPLYSSGLYSIKLFNGSTNENANYVIDALIAGALKTYAAEFIELESVDSITNGLTVDDSNYDYKAWPNELLALIDAIKDLQTVDNLDKINLNATNITDILPANITASDIDTITYAASKSLLLSSIIESKLVNVLKNEPMIGNAANDPNIVWMDTFTTDGSGKEVVLRGEINSLLKSFVIFSDDEKNINLNDTDSLINGLAQLLHEAENGDLYVKDNLDYQEVVTFTNSQVLMTLLSEQIAGINTGSEGMSIVIPYSLNTSLEGNEDGWKNWAYDNVSYNHMNGEFANLVLVLYQAREYLISVNGEPEDSATPVLTQENLIDAIIYMGEDNSIIQSKVLHASLSDALLNEATKEDSIVKYRSIAVDDYQNLNPEGISEYLAIKEGEIVKALDAIRAMDITLAKINEINLETVLDAITTEEGEDPNDAYEARRSICLSNVFNISAVTKIYVKDKIYFPQGYYDSTNIQHKFDFDVLYPTSEANWENSEINKMLESVVALELEANGNELNIPEDPIQFLKKLNESKVDKLYESKIFSFTISKHTLDNVEDYRIDAIDFDDKGNEYVDKKEINLILEFLNEAGINTQAEMKNVITNTSVILEKIKNSSTLNEIITESNILNINVVNVLKDSPLSFPDKFSKIDENNNVVMDSEADAWYPAKNSSGEITLEAVKAAELYKLLNSVVILGLNVGTDGKGLDINPTTILNTFKDKDKLYSVYVGEIIPLTITKEITKITEIHAREKAFNPENNNSFYVTEIEMLVDFVNLTNIDINAHDLDAEHILGSSSLSTKNIQGILYDETPYKAISGGIVYHGATNGDVVTEILIRSNILNDTMVTNICGASEIDQDNSLLVFPKAYFKEDSNYINHDFEYWYHDAHTLADDWANGELYHLLISMKTLGIKAHGNAIDLNEDKLLDDLLTDIGNGKCKLDVVYESDIFAATISRRLFAVPTPKTTDEAAITLPRVKNDGTTILYEVEDRIIASDEVILEPEVKALLFAITEALGKDFHADESNETAGFEYKDIFKTIKVSELLVTKEGQTKSNLELVLESSILHYIISDSIINQKQSINDTTSYGIVTWDYYLNKDDKVLNYVNKFDDYKYLTKTEIKNMITSLELFGVESIENASSFNVDTLYDKFGTNSSNTNTLINSVVNSAVMSKIFSQIITSNQLLLGNLEQKAEITFVQKEVITICDNANVFTLTQEHLALALNTISSLQLT